MTGVQRLQELLQSCRDPEVLGKHLLDIGVRAPTVGTVSFLRNQLQLQQQDAPPPRASGLEFTSVDEAIAAASCLVKRLHALRGEAAIDGKKTYQGAVDQDLRSLPTVCIHLAPGVYEEVCISVKHSEVCCGCNVEIIGGWNNVPPKPASTPRSGGGSSSSSAVVVEKESEAEATPSGRTTVTERGASASAIRAQISHSSRPPLEVLHDHNYDTSTDHGNNLACRFGYLRFSHIRFCRHPSAQVQTPNANTTAGSSSDSSGAIAGGQGHPTSPLSGNDSPDDDDDECEDQPLSLIHI